jgi:hypothetical protein
MNTQDSNQNLPSEQGSLGQAAKGVAVVAAAAAALSSCRKEEELLFNINDVELYASAAEKVRPKSNEQFVSILFTNLFQTAISSDTVFELNQCLESIGDKELGREVLISNFFNNENVLMPTVEQMNADIDAFIEDTYKRFYVRLPSEAEKQWVKNFIQNNPYMTPELVYFSFALSTEYMYY